MNEETTQEVITYLLGEVKRLTSELDDAKKRIKDYEGWYEQLLNERTELENKCHSLRLEISNKSEKNKKSLDPCFQVQ